MIRLATWNGGVENVFTLAGKQVRVYGGEFGSADLDIHEQRRRSIAIGPDRLRCIALRRIVR
jgi:hypothetical protein